MGRPPQMGPHRGRQDGSEAREGDGEEGGKERLVKMGTTKRTMA